MKLRAEALAAHLKKTLLPIYLIAGDETLLVQEAADAVRAAARADGFTDRDILFAERGFDWGRLAAAGASLSLFASRQLLELRLPSGKPGRDGGEALANYAAAPPPDTLLLVIAPKLDRRGGGAAWLKALDNAGAVLEIWPVGAGELPRWIAQRARGRGLQLDDDAARLLAERVEGNLLAAAQEVDKLVLSVGPGHVGLAAVQAAVSASARYDVFGLVDAALGGNSVRALAMLAGLKAEGVAPTLVLWALTRDIRILADAAFDAGSGKSVAQALGKVWPTKRRALVEGALRRLGRRASGRLLMRAAEADRIIKGPRHAESWSVLTALVAMLAGALPVTNEGAAA
ncbi:MAG TPA: DNA polymerase III subunit delta [Gammaproteobacteria bacterium]|nr:DNA polymerase III subunit delta [Gammaproteobacteria bacterium]